MKEWLERRFKNGEQKEQKRADKLDWIQVWGKHDCGNPYTLSHNNAYPWEYYCKQCEKPVERLKTKV